MRNGKTSIKIQASGFRHQVTFKRLCLVPFVLCLASCLFSFSSFSQSVSATLDRDKILLGEQVLLELKAENINTASAPLTDWFLLPDTINHIEVVKRSPIDTLAVNGTIAYTQTITLTSFDSGEWKLPFLFVLLQNNPVKKDTLRTSELTIQVVPVDISNLPQYHAMKDIIDVDVKPNYLLFAGIGLLAVLVTGLVIWLVSKNKKKEPVLKPVAARSLFETAMEQLDKLEKDNPPLLPFYIKLDEITRAFIQNQLQIRAMQLTSDELMMQMNVYIKPDARTSFYQLLRLINVVKFAKYKPDESQKTADVNTAREAIQHIYYHLQRSLQHAE